MSYDHSLLLASISKHLREKPATSIASLSRSLGVSYRLVQQVVCDETGKSFSIFRREVLLGRLSQLFISQPGMAIKEASFDLGFCSPRSFARAVKRACGFSPHILRSLFAAQRITEEEMDVLGDAS